MSKNKLKIMCLDGKHATVLFLYLWVDIQDADLSCFYHLVYGVYLCAVQVPVILAMLQETTTFDVALHFASGHERVQLTISLIHLWLSGGDCEIKDECKQKLIPQRFH